MGKDLLHVGNNILDIFGLIFVLIAAVRAIATLRVFRSLPRRAVLIMTGTSLRSSKAVILLLSIIGLFCSILQVITPSSIPPFPPLLVLGGALIGLNAVCLPPTVLYLASSKPEGILLCKKLIDAVTPLKVINFLNTFESEPPLPERERIRSSSYRVRGNWQTTVMDFCEFVPLIIVDARVMTDPLMAEINLIMNSGGEKRTIFVAHKNEVELTLLYLNKILKREIQVSTSSELLAALRLIGFKTLVGGRQNLVQSVTKRLEDRDAILIR